MTSDVCQAVYSKKIPIGKRPNKLLSKYDAKAASGTKLVCEGICPIPFTIDRRKFEHNLHVFSNLQKRNDP
jgi:hypothetical protein